MSADASHEQRDWLPLTAELAGAQGWSAAQTGRKGAALATLVKLGLAVPATAVIPVAFCSRYLASPATMKAALREAVLQAVAWIERQSGHVYGGQPALRLIVRPGAQHRTMGLAEAKADLTAPKRSEDGEGEDRWAPMTETVAAAFASWNHPLARRARAVQRIEDEGMAVIIQQMMPGAVRTWLTRDPRSGKATKPPANIRRKAALAAAFEAARARLERHHAELVEFDGVMEGDRLVLLDARIAERESAANMRVMTALVDEGLLTPEQALRRVHANDVAQFLLPTFSPAARDKAELLTQGVAASSGVATGRPAFSSAEAIERAKAGESVILVRHETYPEDIDALRMAAGILTTTGGMTSHAAVVARGWGKCCIVGAGEIRINPNRRRLHVRGRTFTHEDSISLDGASGQVIAGQLPMLKQRLTRDLAKLLTWADASRSMTVLANADTAEDARRARSLGAQGVGLCRTEHMFFESDRIESMRRMILASSYADRMAALERLLPMQRRDFIEIFRAMDGLPVTVRLLDPPLHEFLPREREAQAALAKASDLSLKAVKARVTQLHESNPMMGHRGCRLSMSHPEILQMQVRAIVEATIERRRLGGDPRPAIMHPLVTTATELKMLRESTLAAIEESLHRVNYSGELSIPVGSMIETPRAALVAGDLAEHADFFSLGTNDLTQLTYGFSRDDSATFLPLYLERGVLLRDPFESLDATGVGTLVGMAVELARAVKPGISISVCGEHGGDADSIAFFQRIGVNAISSSPFRVPVARLAAGQAGLG